MRLFAEYLRTKRYVFAVLVIFAGIFFVTFALYHLPLSAVLYPAAICIVLGGTFTAIDYRRTRCKHDELARQTLLPADVMHVPDYRDTIPEADYAAIIEAICREFAEYRGTAQSRYRDMIDYYTVWAHQIKTPIAAMKLTLQNEDSELSRRIASDVFRIQQYVDMVMAFLRLGSESSDYIFKEYRLDELIRACVKKFASEFIGRKLSFKYEPADNIIVTDEKWFDFMLGQFLSNALKYTKSGGIEIFVKDGGMLCIKDTGIGIAAEDLPRIFEKGYTGCNGRTDKAASGLGLYLCRCVADKLGIGLSIESEQGAGTCVMIDISDKMT